MQKLLEHIAGYLWSQSWQIALLVIFVGFLSFILTHLLHL